MTKHLITVLAAVALLTSCGSIKPEAPDIVVLENYDIKPAEASMIKVPIKINLKPYFDDTDKEIDRVFRGEEQQCSGVSYKYKFVRSPIDFTGKGNKLHFDVDGAYAVWLNYCPTCSDLFSSEPYCLSQRIYADCGVDEPMRKMQVGFATEIGLAKDYHLKSETKLRKVKAVTPCKVSGFNFNATSILEEEVSNALKDVSKDIDKEISAVSLRSDLEDTWKLLGEPIDMEGYGFMELNPEGLSVSKIYFTGDSAYFKVMLKARPEILSKPSGKQLKKLPNLTKYQDREGFDIKMDVFTDYDSLSAILTREVAGMELDVKGKTVIFDSIAIHGASNRKLSIRVDFSGSKTGTLYLIGTPVFDRADQHISFPDLEFDIKTKSALLKAAKWLFDKKITHAIREEASMDLKPYLEDLRKEIGHSVNGYLDEDVYMWGKVNDVKIDLIHPLSDRLHVRINSLGKIGLKIQ